MDRDSLLGLSKNAVLEIFKTLNNGSVGFDHERMRKVECVNRLIETYGNHPGFKDACEAAAASSGGWQQASIEDVQAKPASTAKLSASVDQGAIAQQIAGLFASMAAASVDESRVKAIVDGAISEAVARLVNRVEVKVADLDPVDVGVQHKMFPTLLRFCSARTPDGHRLNTWLAGPAGSGKTTAAKMVAKALGLEFYFNGAIAASYELIGFIDAGGTYHRTPFRNAWENGGVYIFDEVDGSNPNAVLAFNAALANGIAAFPDGMIPRHPDCVILAGANTFGKGATADFSGRMKQDDAFLDRFVPLDWHIDEKLEAAITPNTEWVRRVQGVRSRIAQRGIKGHKVTPRASVYGAALLAAGVDMETVEAACLRKGLDQSAWDQVK